MGLVEGLGKLGKKVIGAIRQPRGGPTFNIKGSAAGGGLAQCIPLTDFSLGLTGDIDAITNAHNLAMVALTSRMQHEFNYDDARLAKSGPEAPGHRSRAASQMGWAIDFCAQALREHHHRPGRQDGRLQMESGFQITVSTEVMAILAVATDLKDLRERMGRIVVAYSKTGGARHRPPTWRCDGAMTAWMVEGHQPEPAADHRGPAGARARRPVRQHRHRPELDHRRPGGPEAGRLPRHRERLRRRHRLREVLEPQVPLLAASRPTPSVSWPPCARSRCTAAAPRWPRASPWTRPTREKNVGLVEKGCENLLAHIETVQEAGIEPVVCINHFYTDTDEEIAAVRKAARRRGARVARVQALAEGRRGRRELAEAVSTPATRSTKFKFLYELSTPLSRAHRAASPRKVYGADGVTLSRPPPRRRLKTIEADPELAKLGTCMVKTHLSLSHDPDLKGRPKGWTLPIRDILIYQGAGFVVPVAGRHQADARHRLGSRLPPHRRGRRRPAR